MVSSNDPKIRHYLGIDYGLAKIGLAIAESETRLAFGYGEMENNKDLLSKLAEIRKNGEIDVVIIGLPGLKNQGTMGNKKIYQKFSEALKKILPDVEIVFAEEMFTTKMAQDNLKEKGTKHIKDHDHKEAARIILQGWLDQGKIFNLKFLI